MNSILVGDYSIETWLERFCKNTNIFQSILDDEQKLINAYLHAIKIGCKIIRTPTTRCSLDYLKNIQLDTQIEPLLNLAVSSAKKTIQNTKQDVLLAGTLGPILNYQDKTDREVIQEISELVIYLSDFGIDHFVIQDIDDWRLFSLTLETTRRLSHVPIAPFYAWRQLDVSTFEDYKNLVEALDIELIGLTLYGGEVDLPNAEEMNNYLGFMFDTISDDFFQKIKKADPTLIIGSSTCTKETWTQIIQQSQ